MEIGLTDSMWELMGECWKEEASYRPSARGILNRLPRNSDRADPATDWTDMSPSYFRTTVHGMMDLPPPTDLETLLSEC